MLGWGKLCSARPAAIAVVLALGASLAVGLGGCATQPREEVVVRVGVDFGTNFGAVDYAALYAPYAMMATIAYTNENALNGATSCPDPYKLARHLKGDSDDQFAFNTTVAGWVDSLKRRHHWECISGRAGSLPCPKNLGSDCKPVGGLEYHVWRHRENGQCRIAIAFRGTDKSEIGDWVSNFRWLYRLVPKFDQYAQVQTHIADIIKGIRKNGCGGAVTEFVSVGHSLGGGLAQQAAYAGGERGIHYVYAFDPSPVTGFFDVSAMISDKSVEGLGIDRTYEAGEILALPRMIVENFIPPAPCRPRIRTVRFNLLTGFGVAQHSIEGLTKNLIEATKGKAANPRRVNDALRARVCKGAPMLVMVPPA